MSIADILRSAIASLRGNWMRSLLTALGVIIGIAAVIVMVSVAQGTSSEIDRAISRLGSNRLDISSGAGRRGGVRGAAGADFKLDERDLAAITAGLPEVQYATGTLRGGTQVIHAENNWSSQWQGVTADWFAINEWTLSSGNGFSDSDYGSAAKVVIVGETVRRELFGDADPVGATVRIGRVPFSVAGVLQPRGQGGFGQDQDDLVVVPLATARRRLSGSVAMPPGALQSITLGIARAEDLPYVEEQVAEILRTRHRIRPGEDDDFEVRNIAEVVSTRTQTARLMSVLLGAVAGISLVVGGIGIMNIMLVTVTERIREIGLRMAVGAGPRAIERQFLAEAMLLSLGGGLIGIAIGIAGALIVGRIGTLPVALDWDVVALATACAVATGLFFGYYPARKAARLDPIEALRHQG